MSTTAILLNADTIFEIQSKMTATARACFSYACLTSAYNGEHWYYVTDPERLGEFNFSNRIITEEKLNAKYDYDKTVTKTRYFNLEKK